MCERIDKSATMLDIKSSADYLSRSTGSFSNFSMLFGTYFCSIYILQISINILSLCVKNQILIEISTLLAIPFQIRRINPLGEITPPPRHKVNIEINRPQCVINNSDFAITIISRLLKIIFAKTSEFSQKSRGCILCENIYQSRDKRSPF